MPKEHLIDVRTPLEYSTGFLSNAINIEYTSIASLPNIIPSAQKTDAVTLYCRSGRRSAIAMQELQTLGWENVRDIGGFEDARRTLEEEQRMNGDGEGKLIQDEEGDVENRTGNSGNRHARQKSFSALLEGLKGAEVHAED